MTEPVVPTDHEIIHALADDLPVGLWVARAPGGELVYANARFGEIMGIGGLDDVSVGGYAEPYGIFSREGQPYPEHRMPFVRAMQERQVVVVDDITIHRRDRSRVDVRAFARPVEDADGVITHVVIAFFDITREVVAERARAEADRRLQAVQRMEAIGTLAGGIAHDFNNLIFSIKLIAADLATKEADDERKQSLGVIDDITERAAALTRSLLGFARRGKHRSAPVAVDDILDGMRELIVRSLLGVDASVQPGARNRGTVVGDRSQLEQIVLNLVVNARDAVREQGGGRVVVATRSDENHVVLEVADDGPGIPAELRDRVFEPYFTTKNQGAEGGTGLGLATVYGIVAAHRGMIEIAPGLEGRGTTMRVTLPAAVPVARPTAIGTSPPPMVLEKASGLVLVVDDDPVVRRALSATLQSLGYTTLEAGGGAEAIELFRWRKSEVRVVLLDMIMPGMPGSTTYGALREIDPTVAVLLMSGHTSNEEAQSLVDGGARGFVAKPYSVDVLAQALATALTV